MILLGADPNKTEFATKNKKTAIIWNNQVNLKQNQVSSKLTELARNISQADLLHQNWKENSDQADLTFNQVGSKLAELELFSNQADLIEHQASSKISDLKAIFRAWFLHQISTK